MKCIFICILLICISLCQSEAINKNASEYDSTIIEREAETSFNGNEILAVIRKCCPGSSYYNTNTHDCTPSDGDSVFLYYTNELLNYDNYTLSIVSRKIDECPGTYQKPEIKMVQFDYSLTILDNGNIYDYNLEILFNQSYYCLEMVGDTIDSSSLVLAYCLGPQKLVPKCCPEGHFFDTRGTECSPYYKEAAHSHDVSLSKFLNNGSKLSFEKDLVCNDRPVKIRLNEAYFNDNFLCISQSKQCYNSNEFCIDNMLKEGENELVQAAFVCPYNFINKCCPDGQSLYEHGCVETNKHSLDLIHILKTSRYKVKSISNLGTQCTPVTLEDNTKSEIKWSIDIHGFVILKSYNETIATRNFCIDDFTSENEIFPVIKVCSEEVKVYHQIASIKDWSQNVLGKCCPGNMYYNSNLNTGKGSQCLERTDERFQRIEKKILSELNISRLVFANFPDCSIKEYYHKYDLFQSFYDYAKITENRTLEIVSKENNCIKKITKLDASRFCVDIAPNGENFYKPVAIVCAASRTYHSERNAIVVSLVGISCAALISAFFSLIFMRVRRGMVTVKKINTLAGRILTSYVLSQLVGYLVLGIGTLADFEQEEIKCFVLAGFLMFFMIASFCWNTSICLEGLLLTMHVQMSEKCRYLWHSAWAWGVPGIITAMALIQDLRREFLPCDAITPKIGVERCFFSDALAQLLYFYLPISITVIINALLLVSAKILRKNKLKKLEKDPNRVRRHENLQQVLSIKSIKSKLKGEPSIKPTSNHSGLRTHHNRNIWIESLKLVLWSGTTWLMEIIGTLVTMYRGRSQGEWYNYLWYLPVGFNCLRGLGIFAIISFNSENKTRFLRTAKTLRVSFSTTLSKIVPSLQFKNSPDGSDSFQSRKKKTMKRNTVHFSNNHCNELKPNAPPKQRSTSVTTIITNISSSTLCTNVGENSNENTLQVPSYFHSISQIDKKNSNSSSFLPNLFECYESDCDGADRGREEDEASLDNTSMENVFWENELQARRNNVNFLTFDSISEENRGEDMLPNLVSKDDEKFSNLKAGESQVNIESNSITQDSKEVKNISVKKFWEDFEYCTHL